MLPTTILLGNGHCTNLTIYQSYHHHSRKPPVARTVIRGMTPSRPPAPTSQRDKMTPDDSRKPEDLEAHGFRPVWAKKYPHPITPEDIKEHLGDDIERRTARVIGRLRSIAWLAGLDELFEAIDSPASVIEDSIEVIPNGASLMWPVKWFCKAGFGSYLDQGSEGVSDSPTPFPLKDTTNANRLQRDSGEIPCMKIKKGSGAIMVFKDPALMRSTVWGPNMDDEWPAWVAKWTGLKLEIGDNAPPDVHGRADFIKGPVSKEKKGSARGKGSPEPSEHTQLVVVSSRACQILADCLDMIIFVKP
ncbi:uncharacterized protein KD926_004653 [Aspergillus affinis]|uniref:uncharacterized protein n=1 Tax=Aspergillus affinis TaxID=1070780 RepID=UPI0022FDFA27|nr:uncharacterized protein KD926_004653 [Aspergillus affinis]KAI9035071.1 hypothetical protein KD926_004653 [Aspergillus affinis]